MLILGIESSCDDSSASVVKDGHQILSNIIANQDQYHRKYGGVVPEIAARKHIENMLGVVELCLEAAGVTIGMIDAIAVTHRPGLIGSLIVGLTTAKSLSYLFKKPILGIHHIEAHAYAACFAGLEYGKPHVALVASGGHTSLLNMKAGGDLELIGQTVDDAAGEAFDKVSKLLGFGYPGGPIIDKLAGECQETEIVFPRPMLNRPDFNFSFSGLKTAVMYHHKKNNDSPPEEIAKAFQDAVVDVLLKKTLKAMRYLKLNTISVVGGVAANSCLRDVFEGQCKRHGIKLFIPERKLCTDNAAMVAGLGYHKFLNAQSADLHLGVDSHSGLCLSPISM